MSANGCRILRGELPDGASLFAAVAPDAHHVEPRLGTGRLAAVLAPFKDEAEARAALERAGAVLP